MALNKTSAYVATASDRFRQGDILRDVTIVIWAEPVNDELAISEEFFEYCVVITQDCDLEHDFNNHADEVKSATNTDKYLPSILLCPAYPAQKLKEGAHAPKTQIFKGSDWERLTQNNTYRYHHLPRCEENQVPALALDFKRYITVPRDVAYRPAFKSKVIVSLDDLFREHLSTRFAHYLCRIGLPELTP